MRPTRERPFSMPPLHRLRAALVPAALVVALAGCYHNVRVDAPSPGSAETVQLRSATVTTVAGESMLLYGVSVTADSVVGRERRTDAGQLAGARIALPRAEVQSVQKPQINVLSLGIPLAGLVLFALALKDGVFTGLD